jgi:hypothetical protein
MLLVACSGTDSDKRHRHARVMSSLTSLIFLIGYTSLTRERAIPGIRGALFHPVYDFTELQGTSERCPLKRCFSLFRDVSRKKIMNAARKTRFIRFYL